MNISRLLFGKFQGFHSQMAILGGTLLMFYGKTVLYLQYTILIKQNQLLLFILIYYIHEERIDLMTQCWTRLYMLFRILLD